MPVGVTLTETITRARGDGGKARGYETEFPEQRQEEKIVVDLIRQEQNGVFTVSGAAGSARYEPLLGKGSVQANDGNHLWEYLPAVLGERAAEAFERGEDNLWPLLEGWYRDRVELPEQLLL